MKFEEKVLLEFDELENGGIIDEKYSGESYDMYKEAVEKLTNSGYIERAVLFKDPRTKEIQAASLKAAYLTRRGQEKVNELRGN